MRFFSENGKLSFLIAPAKSITDPVARARARGLSLSFLSLFVVLLSTNFIWPILLPAHLLRTAHAVNTGSTISVAILYAMSRTRRFEVSAVLLWILSIAIITLSSFFHPDHNASIETSHYLVLPIFIANALFPLSWSVWSIPVYPLVAIGLWNLRADLTFVESANLFVFMTLTWTVSFVLGLKRDEIAKIVELQRQSMQNVAKFAALGEMAAGVAHEINNPLTIIEGRVNRIRTFAVNGELDPAKLEAECHKISETVRRISGIVRGLRTFARNGQKDPFALVRVRTILEDSIVVFQDKLKIRGIQFECTPKEIPDSWIIECRAVQICQILVNLVGNSIDALDTVPTKWIKIEIKKVGATFEIRVKDSGPGVPVEAREKLFEPFFTTKEVGKGTGMGLSISQSIAEDHRGTLELELDPKSSHTTFALKLPAKQQNRDALSSFLERKSA